jgi:hypothetical protein
MFENEKLYLAAVENYRRESTAAAAIRIYDTFFEQHAPKKIEIAAFDRSNVFEHIVQYRHTEKQREAMGFFQRMTSPGTKVDSKVFDAVTRAVKLKFRVSTAQYSMLEMIRLKNHHRMVLDQVKAQTKAGSHGLSAEAVAQHLRESALTINFCSTGFFADQPEVGSKYLNIWERNTNDDRPEGYAAKRGAAEKATFGFQGGELPSDRPRYAALNYGRLRTGAAMHYGWSYFILKQDVKDRATFTHDDTFYISKYIVTDASLQELRGKIPDAALQGLRAVKDPQRKYTVHEFETLLKSFGLQESTQFAQPIRIAGSRHLDHQSGHSEGGDRRQKGRHL